MLACTLTIARYTGPYNGEMIMSYCTYTLTIDNQVNLYIHPDSNQHRL